MSRDRAALVGAVAALVLLALAVAAPHETSPHGDELIYERMARHPFATHTFPFGYRIGLPLLVHVLPFSHDVSFVALAVVATALAAAVVCRLMTALGASPRFSAAAALVFATAPVMTVAIFRGGRSVDPLTILVMTAAALFVVRRRYILLAAVLLAGSLVRESCLFMVPFAYAVWAQRPIDRDAASRVLGVAAPALALYVALRLAIPTTGREYVVGYSGPFLSARMDVIRRALDGGTATLRHVFLALGPLWLVAPFALRGFAYARRGLVLAALCAVALTYAADWERVLVLLVPLAYPAAGFVVRGRRGIAVAVVAACVLCNAVYVAYMARAGVRHIEEAPPPAYPLR